MGREHIRMKVIMGIGERVLARTLGYEGVDCEISNRLERGMKHYL